MPCVYFSLQLFHSDIEYLLSMEKLWQSRTPPTPLELVSLPDSVDNSRTAEEAVSNADGLPDQRVWSPKECGRVFTQR